MRPSKVLALAFVVAFMAVLLPRLGWTAFDTYVLGNPDYKLGAKGGVMIVAYLAGACAVVAGIIATVLGTIMVVLRKNLDGRAFLYSTLLGGLLLSGPTYYVPRIPGWGYSLLAELGGIAVNWALICAVVFIITYAIVRLVCRLTTASTPTRTETVRAGDAGR